MPRTGPHEPLLDRYTDHLRVVRNLVSSTVSNSVDGVFGRAE